MDFEQMEATNETTTTWPPIRRGRSSLTCSTLTSWDTSTASEPNTQLERGRRESCSYVVNDDLDPSPDNNDVDKDGSDDDSEELRALTSAAASLNNTDESSDEIAAAECGDGQDDCDRVAEQVADQSFPSGDRLAPLPVLSSSSASVLGRIAAGFSTAVSGGLHPLKRSPRVAPEPPTPRSPSPKEFFWGPVMPGYPTPLSDSEELKGGQSTMVIRQTVQLEQTQTSNNNSDADIGLRQAIPIMPMYMAVICCLLNAISPGLGTFVAGLSLVCCSRPQRENIECSSVLLVNVWVALFQLIFSVLFLVGYIWSLIWGFSFITISQEFNSKQEEDSGATESSESRQDTERAVDAVHTSTTTTAMTRTTTTTVSLPDDCASASPTVNREPPIIVLQEAPVAPRQQGLLDAAAAAIWIERQRTLHDPSRASARERVATVTRNGSRSVAPMSRRQRLNRRRQTASTAAATAGPRPFNDPLTGVLLCPEALEHIVVHSSIVPDHNDAGGTSGTGGRVQSSK